MVLLRKKKSWTQCGNVRAISLVAHAGKALLQALLSNYYCEGEDILPEE